MLHFSSVTVAALCRRALFSFARAKKDSQWIYASQSEQMAHAHQGTITLSVQPSHPFDSTIRLHRAIQNSHIILSPNPVLTQQFLKKFGEKAIYQPKAEEGVQIYESNQSDLIKWKEQSTQNIDPSMELAKQLEMAIQTQKIMQSNNDRENIQLKQQQEKLIQFMEISSLKEQLETFRSRNSGWPKVESLAEHLLQVATWRKGGIQTLCLLDELKSSESKKIFSYLQNQQLPYEILPSPNSIISTLAASGFPADRFAIQYFPNLSNLFSMRAPMKMTIAIIIESSRLKTCLEEVSSSYGDLHLVYVECQNGSFVGRGEVRSVLDSLKELKEGNYRVAVAPYISTFNESLKQQKNKITRLFGQAMHDQTHFVRMEFINKQIQNLQKQSDAKQVLLYNVIQKLLSSKISQEKVASIVAEVIGSKKQKMQALTTQVRSSMTVDHLGIAEMTKGR